MSPSHTESSEAPFTVLILHRVQDYGIWKQVFDGAAGLRRDAGERHYEVLRDSTEANVVVHLSQWTSHERAKRFFESPHVDEIRRQAGVEAPRFLYLNSVEQGVL